MNTSFFLAAAMLSSRIVLAQAAGTADIVVENRIIATKPVSPELYGGMSAVTDGRPENMLSQLLFDRGFELPRSTFDNSDFQALVQGDKKQKGTGPWESDGWNQATWWHSGYEENGWYLAKAPEDKASEYQKKGGSWKWPAGAGEYYAAVTNKSKTSPVSLAQDGIRVRKGISYTFSGLFCDGTHFGAQRESKNPVTVTVALYPEKRLDLPPLATAELTIDTIALNRFTVKLPASDNDCRATFAITVPPGKNISADMLSLQPSDSVDGFRPDVIEAVKRVHNGPIRWPGGCDASTYDWRSGIGPLDERPVNLHTWWGLEDMNDIGTVEFVKFCRLTGIEPMLCVPVMFARPENAADWVAFCNAKTHLLRPNSGATGPLKVKYWELENEMYRRFDAITYARRSVEFSKAMKAVDPSIKIIMGNYWAYHPAFKDMLEIAGPHIDMIVNRGGSIKELQDDAALLRHYNAAHGRDITLCDSEYNAREFDPVGKCAKTEAAAASLEGGALQPVRKDDKHSYFDQKCRWFYALGVMSDFMDFHNFGGDIQFINFFCTMDFWGASLVNCGKEQVFLSATGQAIVFLKDQPVVWPLAVANPKDDKTFKASAAWNKGKTELTILILNYGGKEREFSVVLSGFKGGFWPEVSVDRIYAPSPDVFAAEGAPSSIVRETAIGNLDGTKLQHLCKPYSATAIRLKIAQR
jgi:alpha-N-arabinofuranosidase